MPQELKKRRVVAVALEWTKSTAIAPGAYEQWLLEEYVCGRLSISRVLELLEDSSRKSSAPTITSPSVDLV